MTCFFKFDISHFICVLHHRFYLNNMFVQRDHRVFSILALRVIKFPICILVHFCQIITIWRYHFNVSDNCYVVRNHLCCLSTNHQPNVRARYTRTKDKCFKKIITINYMRVRSRPPLALPVSISNHPSGNLLDYYLHWSTWQTFRKFSNSKKRRGRKQMLNHSQMWAKKPTAAAAATVLLLRRITLERFIATTHIYLLLTAIHARIWCVRERCAKQ